MVVPTRRFGPRDPLYNRDPPLPPSPPLRPPSNTPTSGERPGLRPGEPYHPLGESDREHDPVEQARAISTSSYSRKCVSTVKFKPRKVMRQGYTSLQIYFLDIAGEKKKRKHTSYAESLPR